ncbi:hypothetical protein K432DRAFT_87052 [Lepidopterella palustris CBS 459.81]|uniref:F-box domain-containing protein n=1 Tax=Lepidopterella palustris CBS 459.81 TaxID=1314670 RepID=A0A8E2JE56_9PEZI|nr:hypothetical protein K432DRAFT_87052 [Lepidopterella palustris CBS 459.81]
MSASTRVLSTYELLEAILCQLPQIEDLLLAQSVSRVWRSVILRSKLLRRKMWYPESQPSAQPLEQCLPQLSIYSISQRRINPMLNRLGSIQIKENDQWHERPQWCIVNSQSEPIYPSLGPWCGMLATNPACKYMQFEFLGSYVATSLSLPAEVSSWVRSLPFSRRQRFARDMASTQVGPTRYTFIPLIFPMTLHRA